MPYLSGVIGLADISNDVVAANRRPLTDVLRLLNPVTGLTREYNQALYCSLAGAIPMAKLPPTSFPNGGGHGDFIMGHDSVPLSVRSAEGCGEREDPSRAA